MWLLHLLAGWVLLSIIFAWLWHRHCVLAQWRDEQAVVDWEKQAGL